MSKWVWQRIEWPNFSYASVELAALEQQFMQNAGYQLGVFMHVAPADQEQLKIDLVSDEAVQTSAIEGEMLDRASVQASLRRIFGLSSDDRKLPPSEQGIAYMMVELYKNFAAPLSDTMLCDWHLHLLNVRSDLNAVGSYRRHIEPMQIVSGAGNKMVVHYEAPPSAIITPQMGNYISWYNSSTHLPALTRAGIAHLYFELIHPFEDGNGRIGRAVAERAISQSLQQPLLLALSRTIQKNKKQYYAAIAAQNTNLDITAWLIYFSKTVLAAQEYTRAYIEFIIAKAKLYDRVKAQLNPRQDKVLARIFKEGLDGFAGGLSAENYISIAQTSRATATRDLHDLLLKEVLFKTGDLKGTRYYLNI